MLFALLTDRNIKFDALETLQPTWTGQAEKEIYITVHLLVLFPFRVKCFDIISSFMV